MTSRETEHEINGEVVRVNMRSIHKRGASTVAQGEGVDSGQTEQTKHEATAHLTQSKNVKVTRNPSPKTLIPHIMSQLHDMSLPVRHEHPSGATSTPSQDQVTASTDCFLILLRLLFVVQDFVEAFAELT